MSEKKFADNLNYPLISVIVPVYNTEKYLRRCIDSILAQTYQQIELIVVDDGSQDNSASIIADFMKREHRIKLVRHEKNQGLFQARISGCEAATGAYIAFVDSDDYVGVDWFRKLLRKAETTQADMVVGEWCYDFDGKYCGYPNLDHFRVRDYCLTDGQILDAFMEDGGRNFSWTVVWNKLYKKSLWECCLPLLKTFSEAKGHMVMWEDIAFSIALFANAGSLTNVHGADYFYFKHSNAATAQTKDQARNRKYIADASSAIKFMGEVLTSVGKFNEYGKAFSSWEKRGMGIVYKDLVLNAKKDVYKQCVLDAFECDADDYEEAGFFQTLITPLNQSYSRLEALKKRIASESSQYISFDVFDTLIQRPLLYPADLFELLSEQFNKNLSAYTNFRTLREHAEKAVRHSTSAQEVTLDEIYQNLKENYRFDPAFLDRIKQCEIDLEIRLCTQRKLGKELYDLALECGKKVIICTDMYLPRRVIEKILEKNGYDGYCKLYVSCEIGVTKGEKTLFDYVCRDLNEENTKAFLHIGDNVHSDVRQAQACGWNAEHLQKAAALCLNEDPDCYGGDAFRRLYRRSFFKEDYALAFQDFTAVRSMTALIANKMFDNPFLSINPETDFNADPKFIGYAALGPHLLAISEWIGKIAQREKIPTIHFVARDGYMVKQAFDIMNQSNVKTNYIRLSRKALVLADVNCAEDLYSVFNKMQVISPQKMAEIFAPIIPDSRKEQLERIFTEQGLDFYNNLETEQQWARCLNVFVDRVTDMDLLPPYKEKLRAYFSKIVSRGDYIFDIGYSGRPESALSNILGFPVGSMYLHVNNQSAAIRQSKYNCPTEVFYQFKPCITGVIREHLLMELGPSTVGFREIDGELVPELEEYQFEYCSAFVTRTVQENALQFVKDYMANFRGFDVMFYFQNEVFSAPLEYYLHYAKPTDRQIFATLPFEDDLGEGKTMGALDFWNHQLEIRDLPTRLLFELEKDTISGVYVGGYVIKLGRVLNKLLPKGSRGRNAVKKVAHFFLR